MDQITRFTSAKGVPLLGRYNAGELEEYLKNKTTGTGHSHIPEWLILQGPDEKWFVKKEKYLPLCAKLLIEARPRIKAAVTNRWIRMIKTFKSEPAMEKDDAFDKLLANFTAKLSPPLMALLKDQKLLWVYEELEQTQKLIPASSRIFNNGQLIPMSSLYVLKRKELLADARIMLPFWYTFPFISAIIAFFKNLGGGKKRRETPEEEEVPVKESADLHGAAEKIRDELLPGDKTLDAYLAELETRWSRIINKQARADLVQDVNSLVRDSLRRTIRLRKTRKITREALSVLAENIISGNTALQNLSGRESLILYMELYMVKLLLGIK
jgi:hypothetical protein